MEKLVESFGTQKNVRPMADILNELALRAPDANALLNPGIAYSEAVSALSAAGFKHTPPNEWFDIYAWKNGCGSDGGLWSPELFHYHSFLSVEGGINEWKNVIHEAPDLWSDSLLPIFYFEGEFYAVDCSAEVSNRGKVFFIYHDITLAYDSLGSMLESIAECHRNGGYTGAAVDVVVNEELVAQTKAAWNACRRNVDIQDWAHP